MSDDNINAAMKLLDGFIQKQPDISIGTHAQQALAVEIAKTLDKKDEAVRSALAAMDVSDGEARKFKQLAVERLEGMFTAAKLSVLLLDEITRTKP